MSATLVNLEQVEWLSQEKKEFARLVNERQYWKITEDEAKKCRDDCDKRIESMLLLFSDPVKIESDSWTVQRVIKTSSDRLEPKRLLELGVSATVIQQATIPGKPYSYVLVSSKNNDKT